MNLPFVKRPPRAFSQSQIFLAFLPLVVAAHMGASLLLLAAHFFKGLGTGVPAHEAL
jgi:hypothetical protein